MAISFENWYQAVFPALGLIILVIALLWTRQPAGERTATALQGQWPAFIRGTVRGARFIRNRITGNRDFIQGDVGGSTFRDNAFTEPVAAPTTVEPYWRQHWIDHAERLFTVALNNNMSFRHLWNDAGTQSNADPSISFNFVVRNDTPFHVTITGVDGQATIDGDECNQPARMEVAGEQRVGPWSYITPTVKQPIPADKGRELIGKIEAREIIRFASGSMRLTLRVEEEGVSMSSKSIGVSFEVDPTGITPEQSGVPGRPMVMRNS